LKIDKILKVLQLIALFVLAFFVIIFAMMACLSSPKAITEANFLKKMEQAGYSLGGGATREHTEKAISSVTAFEPNSGYTIEFYTFLSWEDAREAFRGVKPGMFMSIPNQKHSIRGGTSGSPPGTKTYYVFTWIQETLVGVETDKANEEAVNKALKSIGYYWL